MKTVSRRRFVLLALAWVGLLAAFIPCLLACGPWLPELMLATRQAVLRTPVGDFGDEVSTLTEADGAPALPPGIARVPRPAYRPESYDSDSEPDPKAQDNTTEADDLRGVLIKNGVPADRRENIVVAFQTFRTELDKLAATVQQSPPDKEVSFRYDERAATLRGHPPASAPPAGPVLPPVLAGGLPPEWADYLEGAYRFWHDDLPGARAAWERLLARPQAERLHFSARGAYMLARILQDPAAPLGENAKRYQRVRALVADGCLDPERLASDSLGWEARLALDAKDGAQALRLYYLQAATGENGRDFDDTSLRMATDLVCTQAAADPAALAAAAGDPFVRRVVTLYVACHHFYDEEPEYFVWPPPPGPGDKGKEATTKSEANRLAALTPTAREPADREKEAKAKFETDWLAALTRAGVNDVREATGIAWAAYKAADFPQTAAWLEKAPADDGLACWLRAKMALRGGKTEAAAGFFAKAVRSYPLETKGTGIPNGNTYDVERYPGVPLGGLPADDATAFRFQQFHLEFGIIALARNDYAQALTALLRSGYWSDAAYVAERVMTTDELLAYVRANYPQAPARIVGPTPMRWGDDSELSPPGHIGLGEDELSAGMSTNPAAFSLRYLLARRLARAARAAEARQYYPPVLLPKYDEYVAAVKTGGGASEPKRADALWRAAKIARHLGMELFGTENDPDWAVYEGEYEDSPYRLVRLERPLPENLERSDNEPKPPFIPPVSRDEKRRVDQEQVQPEKRFHYRHEAADLAWRAASLMPDQQEATAGVLAAGGLWLESVHEGKKADRFYQAILRRCGRTELGREAGRIGHFPDVPHEEP